MVKTDGSRWGALVRSLVSVVLLVALVPGVLIRAARLRFGGPAPWSSVPSPGRWRAGRIGTALTERLTDATVADVVIRLSLALVWIAVVVVVLTVIAEVAHMVRHGGLPLPDVRGIGAAQPLARVIATGLLVLAPMLAMPSRATARNVSMSLPVDRAGIGAIDAGRPTVAPPPAVWVFADDLADPAPTSATDELIEPTADTYVVRTGDSIYGIAQHFAGPDVTALTDYAEQLVDLNLGTEMPDGQRLTNAAYIEPGWVLRLPAGPVGEEPVEGSGASDTVDDQHTVEHGETLWSIAEDELGDPARWPEIFDANDGRTFTGGTSLTDPDLIFPGWELDVSSGDVALEPVGATTDDVSTPVARPENVWIEADTVPADVAPTVGEATGDIDEMSTTAARPENVWIEADIVPDDVAPTVRESTGGTDGVPPPAGAVPPIDRSVMPSVPSSVSVAPTEVVPSDDAPELLTLERAAMLSGGVVALLAVRRRNQLRRARPRARLPVPRPEVAATERAMRSTDAAERFARVDIAIRSAALPLIERGRRPMAAIVGPGGEVELVVSGAAELPAPWSGAGARWFLPASTPIEHLADQARRVGAPCPTLVQLGRDVHGSDVYVDLEAFEAIEVGGPADVADAVVAAMAATLAGSVLAEVTTLVGLGVPDEAFLGHRLYVPVAGSRQAFAAADAAIGATATAARSTFDLRARVTSGEAWEPAVLLVGSAAGTITAPQVRTGLAIVSASPIQGPSSRLAPDGDAWLLAPIGLRVIPVGLTADDMSAIASLVDDAGAAPVVDELPILQLDVHGSHPPHRGDASSDPDITRTPVEETSHTLLVRLLGPVSVESHDGRPAAFERSKSRELIAWLATHRERSTRTSARTALWDLDVRDATFANVVSEARRSLARLVAPPPGDEWVGRTMTEALPLHRLVRTDAEVVQDALDAARLQPPDEAIATLRPAVDLIVGQPFEGTSYLWPDAEGLASQLVLLATSAAAELAGHCLLVGDTDGVFDATGRGLRVLQGHEELIGLRMRAHARAGDHAGVRNEWEQYERVINADPWSDGEPSPKLVDLRRDLLAR